LSLLCPTVKRFRDHLSLQGVFWRCLRSLERRARPAVDELDRLHGGDAHAAFERAIRALSQRRQFWSRFSDVPPIDLQTDDIARVWSEARDKVRIALSYKQMNVLEPIQLTESQLAAIAAYDRVRDEVAALNNKFQQANAAIRLVKEQAAAGNSAVLEADLIRLTATKERHSSTVAPLCESYLAEKASKLATERDRDQARTALDQYRATIFTTYQGAINHYLQRFNAGFRLDQISSQSIRGGSACTYNVLINNQRIPVSGSSPATGRPSFRTSLSAGDRNALALAFFFASLDQDPGLADKIVVIDDPVSSLDEHRTLTTVQEIRRLMMRTAQVIVLSHSKPFLYTIWDETDRTLRGALELVRDGEGSVIRAWDVTQDMVTVHDRRHELLRAYVASATQNDREVAQSIRPVLEAFCRVAYPKAFPPGTLLGPFLGACERYLGTPDEILDRADIDELRDLKEFGNRFHHDTNPWWQSQQINDAELLNFTQRALAFTKR
jgi:wobble nucleotide-excising tRNase